MHVETRCGLERRPEDYRVPVVLFSDGNNIIPATEALRSEVQFDFRGEQSDAENGVVSGIWIAAMAKKVRALKFLFPCEVSLAILDSSHPCRDRYGDLVPLGHAAAFSDDPETVVTANKGVLVQHGQTRA